MNLLKKFSSKNENSYDDDELYGSNEDNGYYAGDEELYGTGSSDKTVADNGLRKTTVNNGAGKIALKLVRPESHIDAPKIANQLMSGCIVVLDIDSLEREPAIRLIDFLAGVIHVLGGQMIKTNRNTIVVAPNGVDIGDFGLEESRPSDDDAEPEEGTDEA